MANKRITELTGITYGMTDVSTDASGKLYVYLPSGATVTEAVDAVGSVASGTNGELVMPELNSTMGINANPIYLQGGEGGAVKQYSTDNSTWTTYTGEFKITGNGSATNNTIRVSGSHSITLDNVKH